MQEKTMEKTIYDYQINPAKIAPNRSVTPVAIRMQGNQPLPLVLKTPETQLKVTKTYRSVSPSPNLVHTRMESQKGIAIENANPAFLRIQNINHDKNKLYEELNKLNSENNSLNIKIMEMQKRFNEHSSNLQHNDVFLKELVKIKEILEKYDISSFYQKKPIEPMDFHSLQYTIANISKHLKFFEDKLFALWSETDRLGKELINWQTYCTHQETVSQIRFQDLKNQYQQFFNEQAKAPQLIAFCDNEYKNRIKNLEDRVNDLEFGIVSLKVEKEFLVKEINEKNSCIRQFQEKCDTAKQTYDQKVILLTSQLEKMNEIAGESHNRENNLLYENQQLKLQIQNLAANRNELLSKLAKLDQEIMQLREISARFKNENDDFVEKKPNKVSSKEERENFQSSLESLKHKNLEIEQELESLQISKKELELNHNLDQKQIDELLLQNKELQISIAKIQREEKYLKNTNEELEQKISEWMEKYKKLEKEYAEEIEEIKVTYEEEKILGLVNLNGFYFVYFFNFFLE